MNCVKTLRHDIRNQISAYDTYMALHEARIIVVEKIEKIVYTCTRTRNDTINELRKIFNENHI